MTKQPDNPRRPETTGTATPAGHGPVSDDYRRYRSLFEDSPISLWEEDLTEVKKLFDKWEAGGVTDFDAFFRENHPDATLQCLRLTKVLDINRATVKLLEGENKGQLLGDLDKVMTGDYLEALRENYTALAEKRYSYHNEIDHKTLKGRFKRVIVYFSVPPDYRETLGRVFVSILDITRRKQLEEQLVEAKLEAESANEAKSRFLANVSHEVRTPLNMILGMAELLSGTRLDEQQKEYVTIFRQAGQRLLHMMNDILDLSKIEAGKVEVERIQFNLPALVDDVVTFMSIGAIQREVELETAISPDLPEFVTGDAGRLQQILINLLDNALKFTPQGTVTLEVRPGSGADASLITFVVRDTGIGISAHKLGTIFDSFSQANISTTREYGGTGLGLTICKGLADLMGGDLRVQSTPGKGSTFTLELPLRRATCSAKPEANPEPAAPLPQPPSRSILIVEDSANNRLLLEHMLKGTPHRITMANDGQHGVETFMQGDFDMVLMDISMPVMDGYEATRAIRSWEAVQGKPPIPILALTAHAYERDKVRSLEAGCDGHLTKPLSKADLLSAIAAHLEPQAESSAG